MPPYKFVTICGLKVHIVQIPDIINFVECRIRERGSTAYIVTTNANTVVLAKNDPKIREAVNNSDLSIADGYSLVFLSRFYGDALKERAYGPDLMFEFLKISEKNGYSNFFYGSTEETLRRLLKSLRSKFPRLRIAGCYSPPFRDSVCIDEDGVRTINSSNADVLWVGLGGGRQELWMYEHKDKVDIPVLVGVGAAFDFFAGTKPQAPRWIRDNGFEWLFRLITEPNRLWHRYLVNNSLFIYYLGTEMLSRIFALKRFQSNGKN